MTANHTIKNATIIITALFLTCITIDNAFSHEDNSTVIRIIQTLLSKKLHYHVNVDGICKSQTERAIVDYLTSLGKPPQGNQCNIDVIKNVNDLILSTTPAVTQPDNNTDMKIISIEQDLGNIKNILSSITSSMENIKSYNTDTRNSISSNYNTELKDLGILGLSSFAALVVAIITIIFAIIVGMYLYVKKLINDEHTNLKSTLEGELLEKINTARNEIVEAAKAAHNEISAKLYTMLSAHFIEFYQGLPEPATRHNGMYRGYLAAAARMATFGYNFAIAMNKALEEINIDMSDDQETLVKHAINNYVFYLSQVDGQERNTELINAMSLLVNINESMRGHPGEWHYQDTLAWANLYLWNNSAQETANIIQALINRPDIDTQWKVETKKRYEFYNKLRPHAEPVILHV
jgi:hypothetical protein